MLLLKKINQKSVSEKDIEKYLCVEIKKLGGRPYKFNSPARRAIPDRLCVMPFGVTVFIECKRPNEKPTAAQYEELAQINKLGHFTTWVSSREEVQTAIQQIKTLIEGKKGVKNV